MKINKIDMEQYNSFIALKEAIQNSNLDVKDKRQLIILATYFKKEYPLEIVDKLKYDLINVTQLTKESVGHAYYTKMGKLDIKVPDQLFETFDPMMIINLELTDAVMLAFLLENYFHGYTQDKVHDALYNFWGESVTEEHIDTMKSYLDSIAGGWKNRNLNNKSFLFLHADKMKIPIFENYDIKFANLYTVVGINEDGHRFILASEVTYESEEIAWEMIFEDLHQKLTKEPLMLSGDLSTALRAAAKRYFPNMKYQICTKAMRNAINQAFESKLNTDPPADPNLPDISENVHKLVSTLFEPNTDIDINISVKEELIKLTEGQAQYEQGIKLLNLYFDDCFTYLSVPVTPNYNHAITSNSAQKVNNEIKRLNECPTIYSKLDSADIAITCFMVYLEQHQFLKSLKIITRK